jgi:hypothetical protein
MKSRSKLATFCLLSALAFGATTTNATSMPGKSHIIQPKHNLKVAQTSGTTMQRMGAQGEKLIQESEDFRLGNNAFVAKNYSQALPYFDRAVAKYPNKMGPYLMRGMTYRGIQLERGARNYDPSIDKAAMADFQTALKMEPNNPKVYLERGLANCVFLRFSAGREDYLKAARLYQSEGDAASYNDAKEGYTMSFPTEASFMAPPPIIAPPSVGGGGSYHDPSRAVTPY